jgi:4-alpha-glucanotransferase
MRTAGVLAHITSLAAPHGIGTLGKPALRFAENMAAAGQKWWQMLPVGPTGYRDSPYQSPSTFAGNPLLIDLDGLVGDGWLNPDEIAGLEDLPSERVDYGALIALKIPLLTRAARRFLESGADSDYERFLTTDWLCEYALFAALKQHHGGRPWVEWDEALVVRRPGALSAAAVQLGESVEVEATIQFFFHRQWDLLHRHCADLGLGLIGDLPIFVAHDSADVWAAPELFHLDSTGHPTVVAGVPPDYFTATGQRWGNPLYRWQVHAQDHFAWWSRRLTATLSLFDMVRIDHFRGFTAYWEIPADELTALNGRWVEAPGAELFSSLGPTLLPIIAEDLGIITDEVTNLRRQFGFPGMRVAQFGFDEEINTAIHHPSNYESDVVAYTGTHDNDTTVGWFWGDNHKHDRRRLNRNRRRLLAEAGTRGHEIHWDLIRMIHSSRAEAAVVPAQDLLGLGSGARMNTPGREEGNWAWRMTEPLPEEALGHLATITKETGRLG